VLSGTVVLVISPGLNINCPQLIRFYLENKFVEKRTAEGQRTKGKGQSGTCGSLENVTMMRSLVVLLVACFFGSLRGFAWMCDQGMPHC
jgi:hypothetical protein